MTRTGELHDSKGLTFMLAVDVELCNDCSGTYVDAGDELVCPNCGIVKEKSVMEAWPVGGISVRNYLRYPLGSQMGTKAAGRTRILSGNRAETEQTFEHMKAISESIGGKGGMAVECDKVIERVCEKLFLPKVVALEAMSISRKVISRSGSGRRLLVAEVSAYAVVAACKIEGITSSSIREILKAHASLGRKVTSSALNRLSLDSPVKTYAKKPEEYLTRVLGRLMMNGRLARRLGGEGVSATSYSNSLRENAAIILRSADKIAVSGKRPCALAASAVFSAEVVLSIRESRGRRITQKEVAECGDASEYTVREQCATIFAPVVVTLSAELIPPLPLQTRR